MKRTITRLAQRRLLTLASAVALAVPICCVAKDQAAQQRYRQERADCMAGRTTNQDRATCLYEARSALRDARQGMLADADPQTLATNVVRRCDPVPDEVKADCERLARGEGEREGSVAEGGVVMWLVAQAEPSAPDLQPIP
jgi:hypothetical protein